MVHTDSSVLTKTAYAERVIAARSGSDQGAAGGFRAT